MKLTWDDFVFEESIIANKIMQNLIWSSWESIWPIMRNQILFAQKTLTDLMKSKARFFWRLKVLTFEIISHTTKSNRILQSNRLVGANFYITKIAFIEKWKLWKMKTKASSFAENIHPHAVGIWNLNDEILLISWYQGFFQTFFIIGISP